MTIWHGSILNSGKFLAHGNGQLAWLIAADDDFFLFGLQQPYRGYDSCGAASKNLDDVTGSNPLAKLLQRELALLYLVTSIA